MKTEEFDQKLNQLLSREPFQSFVVELDTGNQIEIDRPSLAFRSGSAVGFDRGGNYVRIECNGVKRIIESPELLNSATNIATPRTPEELDRTLIERLNRRPFQTFVVELTDGRRIVVDRPGMAIRDGIAAYIARGKKRVYFFNWKDVKQVADTRI